MKKHFTLFSALFVLLICGCDKAGDCGKEAIQSGLIFNDSLFKQPSEIYWGVESGKRYYTYNWTFDNICTKENPKVDFIVSLLKENNTLSNPFSFEAGTQTCFGVQAHKAILSPTGDQKSYNSTESEIGMNQCFGGKASAIIYPYITVSFTTLGSSHADSVYLTENLYFLKSTRVYKLPK